MNDTRAQQESSSVRDGSGSRFVRSLRSFSEPLGPVAAWSTLAGLTIHVLAVFSEPGFFYLFSELPISELAWVKFVLLVGVVAAAVDGFRPSTLTAAVANVATILVLGSGTLTFLGDTWSGPVVWRLALVVADAALVVGFIGFLGRAASERTETPTTSLFEMLLLVASGLTVAVALYGEAYWGAGRVWIRTAGIWFVTMSAVALAGLTRSRPGLIAAGVGSVVVGISQFGAFHPSFLGVVDWVRVVVLLGVAGLSGWQLFGAGTTSHSASVDGTISPVGAPVAEQPLGSVGAHASFGRRLIAALIDGLIFTIPVVVFYAILIVAVTQDSVALLVVALTAPIGLDVVVLVSYCRRVARTGQSWGRSVTGVYIVKTATGRPPTAWAVFGRELASWISTIPCYLGYFWMIWDPASQTWHDKIAGTIAVRSMGPGVSGSRVSTPDGRRETFTPPVMPAPPVPEPERADSPGSSDPGSSAAVSGSRAPSLPTPTSPAPPGLRPITAGLPVGPSSDPHRRDEADDQTMLRPRRPSGITLGVSDGRVIVVETMLLVGRDPSPGPGDGPCATLAVTSDFMVSKTHLAVVVGANGPVVHDRNSTNGVSVARGGVTLQVPSGGMLDLRSGDRIEFGESWLRVDRT